MGKHKKHGCEEKNSVTEKEVNCVHVCAECASAWLEGWVNFTLLSERMCQIFTPLFLVAVPCRSVYPRVCVFACHPCQL